MLTKYAHNKCNVSKDGMTQKLILLITITARYVDISLCMLLMDDMKAFKMYLKETEAQNAMGQEIFSTKNRPNQTKPIQYNAIRFNTIQSNSIQFNSIQFNSIQHDTM